MSKNNKFHFVKYEFGTVDAENDHEASQLAVHPLAPKQSQILILVSKSVGTPVFPNLDHQELIDRIAHLETAVIWKEQHFEEKAKELETQAGYALFDRKKFTPALYQMTREHDREDGINWDTVIFYLTTFCTIEG